jgi:hypothetical protein
MTDDVPMTGDCENPDHGLLNYDGPCPDCLIERLRDEVAQHEKWHLEEQERHGGEVERLKTRIGDLEEHEAGLLALNKKHRERVEELEERDAGIPFHRCRGGVERVGSKDACERCSGVFVSNGKIDAMWKELHRFVAWGRAEAIDHDIQRATVKSFLAMIGIVDGENGGWGISDDA